RERRQRRRDPRRLAPGRPLLPRRGHATAAPARRDRRRRRGRARARGERAAGQARGAGDRRRSAPDDAQARRSVEPERARGRSPAVTASEKRRLGWLVAVLGLLTAYALWPRVPEATTSAEARARASSARAAGIKKGSTAKEIAPEQVPTVAPFGAGTPGSG